MQLIAVDLDGTLLTSERKPHPRSVEALLEAQKRGVIVVLASGRALQTILPIAELTGVCGPIVSSNGCLVVDKDRKTVFEAHLPQETTTQILQFADSKNLHVNLYNSAGLYFSTDSEFSRLYQERTGLRQVTVMPLDEMKSQPATKILYFDHPPRIEQVCQELSGLDWASQVQIVRSESEYVEFLPAGVHKGFGLEQLANHLGISRENVAALGDYYNDKEMLLWAGTCGVMASAPPDLHELADYIVPSNDEGGVHEFVWTVLGSDFVI